MSHPRWDGGVRLFHWSLLILVLLCWISEEEDYLQVHIMAGYGVLVLVVFRLLWGFVGGYHARFVDFVRSPIAVFNYWRGGLWQGRGHNPGGGYAVLVMLLLLLAQALTGLFNSDELIYSGPLYHLLDSSWTDFLGAWHERLFWGVQAIIGLHIAAIAYYQLLRRKDLLWPMIHGGSDGQGSSGSFVLALLILAALSGLLWFGLSQVPPPQMPW